MTFPELVLSSRGRLWDIRARDASFIIDATVDGIRYPASEMLSICKSGVLGMLRTFRALKLSKLVSEGTMFRKKAIVFKQATGEIETLRDIKFTNIIALRGADPKQLYEWGNPEEFYARYYETLAFSGSTAIEDRTYSIIWNETNSKKQVLTLPIPNADTPGEVIYRLPYTEIMTLDATEELPLYDLDDLLWDYIEREARRREHNPAMVEELNKMIDRKLMELKVGIQTAN